MLRIPSHFWSSIDIERFHELIENDGYLADAEIAMIHVWNGLEPPPPGTRLQIVIPGEQIDALVRDRLPKGKK